MSALPARRPVTDRRVLAVRGERRLELPDELVTEEPMEIRVTGPGQPAETVAVTMRTPGNDFELAVGFLLSEGVIGHGAWVRAVRYCDGADDAACADDLLNTVTVHVDRPVDVGLRRIGTVNASCGVCGSASLDGLLARCRPLGPARPFPGGELMQLPERLRGAQRVFGRTGGLHGAGLFSGDGASLAVREDIGRHNAVDKLVGWAALGRRERLSDLALVVSGRVSFEIVQKAAVAGVPVLVAVSAASSLAAETAERLGICLVGFARGASANVYAHPERIAWGEG
ncbi:MAG TPA: formate dehydrogenase accessory sulfurtransferase FdhD [Acidimicrobiales bacterium]|nr:formate dehydrogenase accessory sulfurtransferase FdhD [Acidimicrobiales bacterium]